MKSNSKFSFPLYRLSWWADWRIKQRIKKAFQTEAPSFRSLYFKPQYALALSCLCIAFLGGGYFLGTTQTIPTETAPAVTLMEDPVPFAVQTRMMVNPYQTLNDNAQQITEKFSALANAEAPRVILADIKVLLDNQTTQLETEVVQSPQ